MSHGSVIIALGGNKSGHWGQPADAMQRAICELAACGVVAIAQSPVYSTQALGGGRQPNFLNSVIMVQSVLPPASLLRLLKRLERAAGRQLGRRWGPRPLDLDIIDFKGLRLAWTATPRRRASLTLPHPESHKRSFVLKPLIDVAPHWRHPALGVSAQTLLNRANHGPKSTHPKALLPVRDA
jgi:2-amino-4-hydroxy-6-hydroxymethyldihydropteridine diphosphokinase